MVTAMKERPHSLVLRVDDEELAKLKAIAEAGDEPVAVLVRRWIKTHYAERFGEKKPPKPRPEARGRRAS